MPSSVPLLSKNLLLSAFVLVCVLGIRAYNVATHPTSVQHDRLHHHQYIRSLAHGEYEKNYEGPYYYAIAAAFTVASRQVRQFIGVHTRGANIRTGIIVTNWLLYLATVVLLVSIAKVIPLSPYGTAIFTLFPVCLPVIQRSYNMARPENLMLPLTLLCCYLALKIFRPVAVAGHLKSIALVLALAFCVTQKITGILVAVSMGLIWLILCEGSALSRIRRILPFVLGTVVVSVLLWSLQHELSGSLFFKHRQKCQSPCGPESASVFVRFNPLAVWENPLRDAQKDSMHNILFADLYGDYWRYGIDAPVYAPADKTRKKRVVRARLGLVVSAMFVLCLFFCSYSLVRRKLGSNFRNRLPIEFGGLFFIFVIGYLFLYVAPYFSDYGKHKFDIIKWEYLLWILPFLSVPIITYLEVSSRSRFRLLVSISLFICIVGGMVQSLPGKHVNDWIGSLFL